MSILKKIDSRLERNNLLDSKNMSTLILEILHEMDKEFMRELSSKAQNMHIISSDIIVI